LHVFLIPRDFPDKHQSGASRAMAEDGLDGALVKLTASAAVSGIPERLE